MRGVPCLDTLCFSIFDRGARVRSLPCPPQQPIQCKTTAQHTAPHDAHGNTHDARQTQQPVRVVWKWVGVGSEGSVRLCPSCAKAPGRAGSDGAPLQPLGSVRTPHTRPPHRGGTHRGRACRVSSAVEAPRQSSLACLHTVGKERVSAGTRG